MDASPRPTVLLALLPLALPLPPRDRLRELRQLLRRPRADSGAAFEVEEA